MSSHFKSGERGEEFVFHTRVEFAEASQQRGLVRAHVEPSLEGGLHDAQAFWARATAASAFRLVLRLQYRRAQIEVSISRMSRTRSS